MTVSAGPAGPRERRSDVDRTAAIPSGLRHARFVATPLTTDNAALDHASYTASPDVIRVHSDGRWPVEDFIDVLPRSGRRVRPSTDVA